RSPGTDRRAMSANAVADRFARPSGSLTLRRSRRCRFDGPEKGFAPKLLGPPRRVQAGRRETHTVEAGVGLEIPQEGGPRAVPAHGEGQPALVGGRVVHGQTLPPPLLR